MRIRPFQFTIRGLMGLVTIVAILVVADLKIRQFSLVAGDRRQRATEFARIETEIRATADAMETCAVARMSGGRAAYWELHRIALVYLVRADHNRALATKYDRAASQPWAGISPDPPEPSPGLPEDRERETGDGSPGDTGRDQ
jgi:hypothetical protein